MKVYYHAIAKQAKYTDNEIWFIGAAGARSNSYSGATWAKKGVTSIAETKTTRLGYNIISAVSRRGDIRLMCIKVRFYSESLIESFERPINGLKKIFIP